MCSAASASRWNSGWTAPCVTASSVNRYAVPISTPIRAPRRASGAAIVATIAADRASCMPPAKRTCSSSGGRIGVEVREDRQLRLPQREARPRTHVAAALGALEHELAGAGAQELPQQPGRGHVQERADPLLLQGSAWAAGHRR